MSYTRTQRLSKLAHLAKRDRNLCHICGLLVADFDSTHHPLCASIDHLTPRSLKGRDNMDNLALSHKVCNGMRGSSFITESLRSRCRDRVVELTEGQEKTWTSAA